MKYLLAVISGVSTTHKVLIGPAIQVWVFSTDEAISSVTGPTLTLVHRVTEVADVDAFSIFVTVVGLVLAWVLWFTHLKKKTKQVELCYVICHQQHPSSKALDVICPKKHIDGPQCPRHLFFDVSILLLASNDMSKSSAYFTTTPCTFLFGSEGLWKRFWTESKCRALLGTVDFILMHHTSHYDPLLPLYCSTRYSQLPLVTGGWT